MNKIELYTHIHAPIDRCFDLARSIDLQKLSVKATNEVAIAGVNCLDLIKGFYGRQLTWVSVKVWK